MDKYIGKRLDGRYKINQLIGVGGMANVYRATDLMDERTVAVKVLRDEFLDNVEFVRRFKNESKAIAVLSHPNIVKVYDVNFSDRYQYIVMEYIDGITLKEYIDRQGVVRWKETVYFTTQILRGLEHAHQRGVVHRDIKPHNIMLLSDGTIKITDFGIARFSRNDTRTVTDKAIGSVHYISPEQASGADTDSRTDIYSVGVLLFEMLTGRLPFEADSPVSVAIKQIQSKAPKPTDFNPDIPAGLEDITIKAMQKNPDSRYQTAGEMLRDIDEFKRNPSIQFEYKYMAEPVVIREEVMAANKKEQTKKKGNKNPENKEKKPVPIVSVLAGITAAFVIVTIAFLGYLFVKNKPFSVTPDVEMPNLVGLKYEDITKNGKYNKFNVEVIEEVYNEEFEPGVIFNQNPVAGRNVKAGATVRVRVSAGVKTVKMPDFEGEKSTDVFAQLKKLDLTYEERPVFSKVISPGLVVKTSPEPNEEVLAQSNVIVYVSKGEQVKTSRVPHLEGLTLEQAQTMLKKELLRVGKVENVGNEAPAGEIVWQSIEAETKVNINTLINLEISTGDPDDPQGSRVEAEGKTLRMKIPMPNMNSEVEVKATIDGKTMDKALIDLSKESKWSATVRGEGTQRVKIYIDGELYRIYELDFDEKEFDLYKDYSEDFE